MAIEAKRGCGYRKAGGIYIVGDLSNAVPVEFLPFCIDYEFARSLTWAEPGRLFRTCFDRLAGGYALREKVALMWVGNRFYSPEAFMEEARRQGISKRVANVPFDLRPGDPVALAHVAAMPVAQTLESTPRLQASHLSPDGATRCAGCVDVRSAKAVVNALSRGRKSQIEHVAGVFCLFVMRAIQIVLPHAVASDPDVERKCAARGIEIVAVPDDDRDHVKPGWKLPAFLLDDVQADLPLANSPASADVDDDCSGESASI